jgi:hypothetical protein
MNQALAIIWLLVGLALIGYHAATGDANGTFPLGGRRVSVGWVALALALYNVGRVWLARSFRQDAQLSRIRERPRREPGSDPDPNFNFTDDPPPS